MSGQAILAFASGIAFLVVLLGIGCFMAFRANPNPIPMEAMFIFRVILALGASAFGTILSGFLEIEGTVLSSWTFKAAGAFAIFVAVYLLNPPVLIKKSIPAPKKPKRVVVPDDRLEN